MTETSGIDRVDRIDARFAEMFGRLDHILASQQRAIELLGMLMRLRGIDPES